MRVPKSGIEEQEAQKGKEEAQNESPPPSVLTKDVAIKADPKVAKGNPALTLL